MTGISLNHQLFLSAGTAFFHAAVCVSRAVSCNPLKNTLFSTTISSWCTQQLSWEKRCAYCLCISRYPCRMCRSTLAWPLSTCAGTHNAYSAVNGVVAGIHALVFWLACRQCSLSEVGVHSLSFTSAILLPVCLLQPSTANRVEIVLALPHTCNFTRSYVTCCTCQPRLTCVTVLHTQSCGN